MNRRSINGSIIGLTLTIFANLPIAAQESDYTICNSILDRGLANFHAVASEQESFDLTKSTFCSSKFESFSDIENRGVKVGITVPVGEALLGLSFGSNDATTRFRERRDAFCASNYNEFRSRNTYISVKSTISAAVLSAWNQCFATLADARAKANGVFAYATIQPNFASFTLNIRRTQSIGDVRVFDIRSVVPSSIKCKLNGNAVPVTTNALEVALECTKPARDAVVVTANTSLGTTKEIAIRGLEKPKTLEERIAIIEEQTRSLSQIPTGSVMSFAVDSCPAGWDPYARAQGRFLVGIGNDGGNNRSGDGAVLSPRLLHAVGGNEKHKLTVAQLPKHSHAVHGSNGTRTPGHPDNTPDEYGLKIPNHERTSDEGNDEPLPILPPFVALNFCIKR